MLAGKLALVTGDNFPLKLTKMPIAAGLSEAYPMVNGNDKPALRGAGSGIGRATCLVMAREGATVIASDIDENSAVQTVKDIGGDKKHGATKVDVTSPEDVQRVWRWTLDKYKSPPTVVVNSAGLTQDSFLLSMTTSMFDKVIDVNLKGTFHVVQTATRELSTAGVSGSIITIASIIGQMGNMGQSNYAASKAAVEAFTKSVAREFGRQNIRCNAVVPGFIKTPMTDVVPDKVKNLFQSRIPLGRMGNPEEVAEVIAFLASDRSSYVNGASITISGGM